MKRGTTTYGMLNHLNGEIHRLCDHEVIRRLKKELGDVDDELFLLWSKPSNNYSLAVWVNRGARTFIELDAAETPQGLVNAESKEAVRRWWHHKSRTTGDIKRELKEGDRADVRQRVESQADGTDRMQFLGRRVGGIRSDAPIWSAPCLPFHLGPTPG